MVPRRWSEVKAVVVYDSRSGNTRRVAEAVAHALAAYGSVALIRAADASATVCDHCDLVVVGGPTESRHATPTIHAFFDRLPADALRGVRTAAFDTRLDWPRLLSGSAAMDIQRWQRESGAVMVAPPESFIVSGEPRLRGGELDRSPSWASSLVGQTQTRSRLEGGSVPA
jgi:hypothetical protein